MKGYALFLFNKVHIIESIPKDEIQTGEKLHTTIRPLEYKFDKFEGAELSKVRSVDELDEVLTEIYRDAKSEIYSIIHIEAHGSKSGIELSSCETASWEWLKSRITRINIATGLNLVITLAACKGAYLSTIAHPPGRAPFFGLIAPLKDIDPSPLEDSFYYLYTELMRSMDMDQAMERMHSEMSSEPFNYSLSNVRQIFERGYKTYRRTEFTEERIKEREERFIKKARESNSWVRHLITPELRRIFRRHIDDEASRRSRFERFKRKFFMCDIFPENYRRFELRNIEGYV